jgi:hypothetical protein
MKDEAVARGLGGGAAEDGEGEGVGLGIGAAARGRDERAESGGGIPAGCVGVTGCGGGRGVRGVVLVAASPRSASAARTRAGWILGCWMRWAWEVS